MQGFAVGGPVGAALGGLIGGIAGFFGAGKKKREEERRLREEFERMTKAIEQQFGVQRSLKRAFLFGYPWQ